MLDNLEKERRGWGSSNTTIDEDVEFKGKVVTDCDAGVWRYELDSVAHSSVVDLVFYPADRYPAPDPMNDSGPLTNVTETSWKTIIAELEARKVDRGGGFWQSYQSDRLHERHHVQEWWTELKNGIQQAQQGIAKLSLSFSTTRDITVAKQLLEPAAAKISSAAVEQARANYKALPDAPGAPAYLAQAPAVDALVKRIRERATAAGWK